MGKTRVRLETELQFWHRGASETSYAEPELAYSLECRLSCYNKEADICNDVNKIHSLLRSWLRDKRSRDNRMALPSSIPCFSP